MSRRRRRAVVLLALIAAGGTGSVWTLARYRANARARQLAELSARAEAAEARAQAAEGRAAAAEAKASEAATQRTEAELDALLARLERAKPEASPPGGEPPPGAEPSPNVDFIRRSHALYDDGIKYFQNGDSAGARRAWTDCLRFHPGNDQCASALKNLAARGKAPEASEDDKRRAVKHWNEGIKFFQKGEIAKARDEWLLCGKFDAGNQDCATGLERVESTYGGEP